MPDPLKHAEWKIFGLALSDATMRAAAGQVGAGYRCLVAGLRRMEEFATGGERWADEILTAYRDAAKTYQQEHRYRPVEEELGQQRRAL
jgi:hypothetical protein